MYLRNKHVSLVTTLAVVAVLTAVSQSDAQAKRPSAASSTPPTRAVAPQAVDVSRLVRQLGDPSEITARYAVSQLVKAGPRVVPAVVPVLEDIDPQARLMAANVFAGLGAAARDAGPPLAAALQAEKEAKVKAAMVEAVGKIGPPAKEAIPHLGVLLASEDWNLRSASARALGEMGSLATPVEAQLAVALLDATPWDALPSYDASLPGLIIVDAIKKISNPPTNPTVLPALFCATASNVQSATFDGKRDQKVQSEAGGVLIKFGTASLPLLVAAIRDPAPITTFCLRKKTTVEGSLELRKNAIITLGYLGAPAVPTLIQVLRDPREDERSPMFTNNRTEAAKALGNIGSAASAALPVLAQILQLDDLPADGSLKKEARLAFAKIRQQP